MIWPLGETLERVKPYVPYQLVPPGAFEGIRTLARVLPEAMSAYYIECRLGAAASQVDFSACTLATQGGREILAGGAPALGHHGVWGRVRDFLTYWADPGSPLYDQLPFIWLEFDEVNRPQPRPCLNFCLDPGYLDGHSGPANGRHPNTRRLQPFFEAALVRASGQPLEPDARRNLANCFDCLPEGGQIIYMAVMLARQPAALKVNVVLPRDSLLAYLAQIAWPGSLTELEKGLLTFCAAMDRVRFDLTVGRAMLPRLGIEFFAHMGASPQADTDRRQFLEQLAAEGLCTPEKRTALLSWSGSSSELYSRQSVPTRLSRSWYVKLVYQDQKPLEAKAYLGFAPSRFSLFSLA